jgi:hypothetical protein
MAYAVLSNPHNRESHDSNLRVKVTGILRRSLSTVRNPGNSRGFGTQKQMQRCAKPAGGLDGN